MVSGFNRIHRLRLDRVIMAQIDREKMTNLVHQTVMKTAWGLFWTTGTVHNSQIYSFTVIPSVQQIPIVSDVEDTAHTDIIQESVSSRSGSRDDDPGTLNTGGGGYQDMDPGTSKTSEGGRQDDPATLKPCGGGHQGDDPVTSKPCGGGHQRDDPVTSKPCGGGHQRDDPVTSKPCGGGHRGDDPVTSKSCRDGHQGDDSVKYKCNIHQEDDLAMLKSSVLENKSSSRAHWLSSSFQQDTTENFPRRSTRQCRQPDRLQYN